MENSRAVGLGVGGVGNSRAMGVGVGGVGISMAMGLGVGGVGRRHIRDHHIPLNNERQDFKNSMIIL